MAKIKSQDIDLFYAESNGINRLVDGILNMLAKDNPKFDEKKFLVSLNKYIEIL